MARMLFLRDIDADVQLRCRACGHGGVLPRTMLERRFGPNYPVLSIAPHYRCSRCDSRDIESRPVPVDPPAAANEEPSFDAPLAALNGLLASLRGEDGNAGAPPRRHAVEPSVPEPPAMERPPASAAPPALPRRKPARPLSELPLADLVADGPADEGADPLWEPVSLADMAARLGGAGPSDEDAAGWDDLPAGEPVQSTGKVAAEKAAAEDDAPAADGGPDPDLDDEDETLMAMRRLLAQAGWTDDAPEEDIGRDALPPPHPSDDPFGDPFGDTVSDGEDADGEPPAAFSHKILVRNDFEDEPADEDFAPWRTMAQDDPTQDDPTRDDPAEDDPDEEEPSDDDILSFAIRDPEKPAPRPAKPAAIPPGTRSDAGEPLDFDQHRAERRAQRPPPPPDDEDGFDRTLAALRSMIEDAANDPEDEAPPVPRKTHGSGKTAGKTADREDEESRWPDREADDGRPAFKADPQPVPELPPEPLPEPLLEPPLEPEPSGRRSAQEREIEEAMKALRGLIEEEPPEPPLPKPRAGKPRPPAHPEPAEREDAPPGGAKPAAEPTPLSKTIAALRGMLELDGRRKR